MALIPKVLILNPQLIIILFSNMSLINFWRRLIIVPFSNDIGIIALWHCRILIPESIVIFYSRKEIKFLPLRFGRITVVDSRLIVEFLPCHVCVIDSWYVIVSVVGLCVIGVAVERFGLVLVGIWIVWLW